MQKRLNNEYFSSLLTNLESVRTRILSSLIFQTFNNMDIDQDGKISSLEFQSYKDLQNILHQNVTLPTRIKMFLQYLLNYEKIMMKDLKKPDKRKKANNSHSIKLKCGKDTKAENTIMKATIAFNHYVGQELLKNLEVKVIKQIGLMDNFHIYNQKQHKSLFILKLKLDPNLLLTNEDIENIRGEEFDKISPEDRDQKSIQFKVKRNYLLQRLETLIEEIRLMFLQLPGFEKTFQNLHFNFWSTGNQENCFINIQISVKIRKYLEIERILEEYFNLLVQKQDSFLVKFDLNFERTLYDIFYEKSPYKTFETIFPQFLKTSLQAEFNEKLKNSKIKQDLVNLMKNFYIKTTSQMEEEFESEDQQVQIIEERKQFQQNEDITMKYCGQHKQANKQNYPLDNYGQCRHCKQKVHKKSFQKLWKNLMWYAQLFLMKKSKIKVSIRKLQFKDIIEIYHKEFMKYMKKTEVSTFIGTYYRHHAQEILKNLPQCVNELIKFFENYMSTDVNLIIGLHQKLFAEFNLQTKGFKEFYDIFKLEEEKKQVKEKDNQ